MLYVLLDVVFEMFKEVLINFVVSEIEDIFDGEDHFVYIESVQCFKFDAFHVEFVIYLFLDVLAIGLEVDQQAFPRLL